MRFRDILIIFMCLIFAGGFFFFAGQRLDPIHQARDEMGLVSNTSVENAPPALAFATVAMGAFRGLIVDVLWMRADRLKEQGQFYDAKQLAEWITVLQPRFAAVWEFQAWNMAYNISVTVPATQWEQRWQWVRNGYELLRDKGIEQNPHSISLYRNLAWIFQHKIAGVTDDAHKDYKRELALAMRQVLGKNPTKDYFQRLASSPKTLEDIMADQQIADMVNELIASDEAFTDDQEFINNYLALRQKPDRFKPEAFDVIDKFRPTPALQKFDDFVKAYKLRNTWKFDIELMQSLNEKFGPVTPDKPDTHGVLRWEHPHVHAMYWAQKGLQIAGEQGKFSVEEKNTDRIMFHALQALFRSGKLIIYDIPGREASVFLRPDLDMFDTANEVYLDRIKKYETLEKGNPRSIKNGHRNFLINSTLMFYQTGRIKKAGKIYNQLRELYPEREEIKVPLSIFVRRRIVEEISSITINDARELILATLREAYFQYAVYEDDIAAAREKWAKDVYDIYKAEFSGEANKGVLRVDMVSFDMMRYFALNDFLSDTYYAEHLRRSMLGRIQVEKPELLKKLAKQEEVVRKMMENAKKEAQQK
jgi:hypothetical protein